MKRSERGRGTDPAAEGEPSPASAFRVEGERLRADGGEGVSPGEDAVGSDERASAFRSDQNLSMSRADQIRELYDQKFYAPLHILLTDYRGIMGISIILIYLLIATVGVQIVEFPTQTSDRLVPWFQDMTYPLGTDNAGRDLVGQVVHSTPGMLQLMLGGALFSASLSVGVGTLSGFKMGMTDRVLMTIVDTVMNLPGLPLLIVIVAVLRPENPFLVGIIMSLTAWAGGARALRAQVLQIRSEDYVEASRAMGISTSRNIKKNVLPQLLPLITINFMNSAVSIIYSAVALYYLGILPVTYLNWGVMLQRAYTEVNFYTFKDIHFLMVPLIVISAIGFGAILTAQAFDRVFNPRLRAKHAKTIRGGDEAEDDGGSTTAAEVLST